MGLVGVELETLVSEPDALTTRPPPCAMLKALFAYCMIAPSGVKHAMHVNKADVQIWWFLTFLYASKP